MYKAACRFSQRATRSSLSWQHSLAASAKPQLTARQRKQKEEIRFTAFFHTPRGQRALAAFEQHLLREGLPENKDDLVKYLNASRILDPHGHQWNNHTAVSLWKALNQRVAERRRSNKRGPA